MKNGTVSTRNSGRGTKSASNTQKKSPLAIEQRVVDVAGLGAVAGQPPDVVASELVGEGLDVVGPTVVEDPGAVLALDGLGGSRRSPGSRTVPRRRR